MFSQYNPIINPTNPQKFKKIMDILQYEVNVDPTPQCVTFPWNLAPTTNPYKKCTYHLPKFSGNGMKSMNEHLTTFSNAYVSIWAHNNDTCICLFVNSLEGRATMNFMTYLKRYLPPSMNSCTSLSQCLGASINHLSTW